MSRDPQTVQLYRRYEYVEPSIWRDVGEIVLYSVLMGLVCVIWLVWVTR